MEAKLLFARSLALGPNNQIPAAEDFRVQSRVVVCKIGQALSQVSLALLGAVTLDGLGLGGTILLPVAGMVGAPLASTVAADLAVFRIESKYLAAVLATALLLTCFARTRRLLRVKAGQCEFSLAETTTPLVHSFRVRVPAGVGNLGKRNLRRAPPPRENSQLEKNKHPSRLRSPGARFTGLAG